MFDNICVLAPLYPLIPAPHVRSVQWWDSPGDGDEYEDKETDGLLLEMWPIMNI